MIVQIAPEVLWGAIALFFASAVTYSYILSNTTSNSFYFKMVF